MNTSFSSVSGNSFRKALTCVAFVAALFVTPALSAQSITAEGNTPSITKSAGQFQAFAHPVENAASVKVHFVNPNEDQVTVTIHDQDRQLAFKKIIGRDAVYHGTFNLSKLTDGEYNITVSNRKGTYTRTFVLETQQKRFALAQ
jgi:subtilase family serine protease